MFGVTLIGVTPKNGRKLVVSLVLVVAVTLAGWLLTRLIALLTERTRSRRIASGAYAIVQAPPLQVRVGAPAPPSG